MMDDGENNNYLNYFFCCVFGGSLRSTHTLGAGNGKVSNFSAPE